MAYQAKQVRFVDTVHMFDRDSPPRVRLYQSDAGVEEPSRHPRLRRDRCRGALSPHPCGRIGTAIALGSGC